MKSNNENKRFEYTLKLFISGASRNSTKAVKNLQRILEAHVPGRYSLQIIDLYQDKSMAAEEQIVALPLLVRKNPLPEQRLVGDMSNEERVVNRLQIATTDL